MRMASQEPLGSSDTLHVLLTGRPAAKAAEPVCAVPGQSGHPTGMGGSGCPGPFLSQPTACVGHFLLGQRRPPPLSHRDVVQATLEQLVPATHTLCCLPQHRLQFHSHPVRKGLQTRKNQEMTRVRRMHVQEVRFRDRPLPLLCSSTSHHSTTTMASAQCPVAQRPDNFMLPSFSVP